MKTHLSSKHKAGGSPFLRSLIAGLIAGVASWLILTLVFSLILSSLEDPSLLNGAFSVAICILSLIVGGFFAAKTNRGSALLSAIIIAATILALCYGASAFFSLSRNLSGVMRALLIISMFLAALLGAKIATIQPSGRNLRRKR